LQKILKKILFKEKNLKKINKIKMNRFVIAVILGMVLATTMAFRMKTTSTQFYDGIVLGEDFPLTREDRPMGHTMHTDEEYYGICNPADSK
jgi:hypothetical protein